MYACENVGARITTKEKNQIIAAVTSGDYMSVSDFVRQAVREKLERENTKEQPKEKNKE